MEQGVPRVPARRAELKAVLAADVIERANVREVQAGDGFRLALEPLLEIGVRG